MPPSACADRRRSRLGPSAALLALAAALSGPAAGCVFAPDTAAYASCALGPCPPGFRCLAEEGICVSECGASACPIAEDAGTGEAPPDAGDGGEGLADAGADAGLDAGADAGPDAGPLTLVTASLPEARQGEAYVEVLAASGGVPPHRFSKASGSLPAGIELTPEGVLSGTAAEAGSNAFVVQVTDSAPAPQVAARGYTLAVRPLSGEPLMIQTAALADGRVGESYAQPLAAAGGAPPYSWRTAGGSLPSGLVLEPAGKISGTPSRAGEASVELAVSDASAPPQVALRSYSLRILPALGEPLTISTEALPSGQVGVYYLAQLQAGGGTAPLTWSVAAGGTLPAGLSLAPSGSLSGTPTAACSNTFTVQVADSSSPQQISSRSLTLAIEGGPVPALVIATASLPEGTVGAHYQANFSATGGTAPVTWRLADGSLAPPGLSLSDGGSLAGTPLSAGTFTVGVVATDSTTPKAQTATRSYPLTVRTGSQVTPLAVATTTLAEARVLSPYSEQLEATGGTAPYTWSRQGGSLPPGITLNASGALVGTPTQPGSFSFNAKVVDSGVPQQTATAGQTLEVRSSDLVIDTVALPPAQQNKPYRAQINASGGTPPYYFEVITGRLPNGLTLCQSAACGTPGEISGTPSTKGHNSFEVKVTDSSAPQMSASRGFTIDVN